MQDSIKVKFFPKVIVSLWTYRLIRIGLGGIFIVAGVTKLMHPDIFVMVIELYVLDSPIPVPVSWLRPTAFFLAILEVVTGTGLLFDLAACLSLITAQLFFFIVILLYGIITGMDVDCGCFIIDDPDKPIHNGLMPALMRDLVMVLAVLYLYWWRWQNYKFSEKGQQQKKRARILP